MTLESSKRNEVPKRLLRGPLQFLPSPNPQPKNCHHIVVNPPRRTESFDYMRFTRRYQTYEHRGGFEYDFRIGSFTATNLLSGNLPLLQYFHFDSTYPFSLGNGVDGTRLCRSTILGPSPGEVVFELN